MNTIAFIIFVSFFYSLAEAVASAATVDNTTIYVFAYSWTPEFCYGYSYPGCSSPEEYWKTHFTIHGLWPQYSTSGYPAYCTTEQFNASLIESDIGMTTLEEYWPNVQESPTNANYSSFWEHEWTKHGTCSGLSQTSYFENAIQLIKTFGTPKEISDSIGKTVETANIESSLGGDKYVSLQCNGEVYLAGAYTCWSQNAGIPQIQIECPCDVLLEKTCSKSTIVIASL